MQNWIHEHSVLLIVCLLYFIGEILAHTTKAKSNSLFRMLLSWIQKEKKRLIPDSLPHEVNGDFKDDLKEESKEESKEENKENSPGA